MPASVQHLRAEIANRVVDLDVTTLLQVAAIIWPNVTECHDEPLSIANSSDTSHIDDVTTNGGSSENTCSPSPRRTEPE